MVGIDSLCVSLYVGVGPTLDDQPNIERSFREPIGGAYEAFNSYFHFWLASQVFGGPLVSLQGYDDEWQVFWGGSRPAGLSQADRPDRAVSVTISKA